MKKLRLLLLEECNRRCQGCCNKEWDLKSLPVCEDFSPYDLIMLTGGEPMLKPNLVLEVVAKIRQVSKAPIFLYTAKVDNISDMKSIMPAIDGITLTLHEQSDVYPWTIFKHVVDKSKSLRLNVFDGVNIQGLNTDGWIVKDKIVWLKNCPLPTDEVFMRYATLGVRVG